MTGTPDDGTTDRLSNSAVARGAELAALVVGVGLLGIGLLGLVPALTVEKPTTSDPVRD